MRYRAPLVKESDFEDSASIGEVWTYQGDRVHF